MERVFSGPQGLGAGRAAPQSTDVVPCVDATQVLLNLPSRRIATARPSWRTHLTSNQRGSLISWTQVLKSATYGVVLGVLFAIWGAVTYLLASSGGTRPFGLDLGTLFAFYTGNGLVGGILVGLMWPLMRWRMGALVIGAAVAALVMLGAGTLLYGSPRTWRHAHWFAFIVMSAFWAVVVAKWLRVDSPLPRG